MGQAAVDDAHTGGAALLAPMREAARAAATYIRGRADERGQLHWRTKSPADFVSDVDVGSETLLRERLHAAAPHAWVLGEECSPDTPVAHGTGFVVDPLDGTTNFLHGYPAYAVSIAAVVDGRIVAGVVHHVPADAQYTAIAGGGAFCDDTPIAVSSIEEPARALIGTGFPFKQLDDLDRYLRQFTAITRASSGIRRAGSAALDLVDVACGRFEGFWELTLAPWDFAAGVLLIREAGGIATDAEGRPLPVAHSSVLAGNRAIHPWLRSILTTA